MVFFLKLDKTGDRWSWLSCSGNKHEGLVSTPDRRIILFPPTPFFHPLTGRALIFKKKKTDEALFDQSNR